MKTGVYIPLFWANRFPQYTVWAHELFEQIKGAADMILVVTDGTPRLDADVEEVQVDPDSTPLLRACFEKAVETFADRGVEAFYYIGADNLHERGEVEKLLQHCANGADVAFSTFNPTTERYDGVTFPPRGAYKLSFSLNGHSWPDSCAFRTDCFTGGLADHSREFIRLTLKALSDGGRGIKAVHDDAVGFYYFQHGSHRLDRSFLEGEVNMPDKDPPRKLRGTNHRLYRDKIVALEEKVEVLEDKKKFEKPPKLAGKLKYGDVLIFSDGTSWQTFARRDWGVFMKQLPLKFLPSVQDCTFYEWKELDKRGAKRG